MNRRKIGITDMDGKEIREGQKVRVLYTDWASKSDNDPRTLEQYLIDISSVGTVIYAPEEARYLIKFDEPNRYGQITYGTFNYGKHGRLHIMD